MKILEKYTQEPIPDFFDCPGFFQRTLEDTLAVPRSSVTLAGESFYPESPSTMDYLYCGENDEAPRDGIEFSVGNCLENGLSCAGLMNRERHSWSSSLSSFCSSSNKDSAISAESSFSVQRTKPTGVGAGLINIGNTCFMNAVLQCFTHTVPLVEGLRFLAHPTPCDRVFKGFCVLCTFRDHVQHSLTTQQESISPLSFFENLNFFSSSFTKFEQEDAHEFLQCFLDRFESCLLDSKTGTFSDENLVKRVFGGSLISKLECCNCGYCSETPEPLIDLSLGIEDVGSLADALRSFTKVEKIEDSKPKFQCKNCKEQVDVTKQLVVDEAPAVAVFHLKRFKANELYVEKIDKHVKFSLKLDLQSYTVDANDDNNAGLKYDLYGIVVHSGLSLASGHYFSFIRSSTDKWHSLDDHKVTEVSEEHVLSQKAYILFYARRGTPWFSNFMEAEKMSLVPEIRTESPKSVLDNVGNAYLFTSDNNGSVSAGVLDSLIGTEHINIDNCTVTPIGESDCPLEEFMADEIFHPLTPPRPHTPDVFLFESPGPSYQTPQDHIKFEKRATRKRVLNKSASEEDAVRYLTRSMSSSRSNKLVDEIFRSQSEGATKKKRKMGGSTCKRASPAHRRHESRHASLSHPVAALLRCMNLGVFENRLTN